MTDRKSRLAVLARTPRAALENALESFDLSGISWVRPAMTGMVMLEGRAGGSGQRFSLGQATVSRATCLREGTTGIGYILGHDPERAEAMALCDLLLQGPEAQALEAALIRPQAAAQAATREDRAKAAAATQVRFFTMERTSSAGAT